MDISTDIDEEEEVDETSTESDDDDYVPSMEATSSGGARNRNSQSKPTTSSGSNPRKRKLKLFEEESDSEEEMLVKKWKKAAKKKSKTAKQTKGILKKTAAQGKNSAKPVDMSKFDPMSVINNKPVDNKSKLSDLVLYIVARNQVTLFYPWISLKIAPCRFPGCPPP